MESMAGLREIPAAVQGGPHKVAFFGCSFMFGHGVEENETLPYYFVQEAKGGPLRGIISRAKVGVRIRCLRSLRAVSL